MKNLKNVLIRNVALAANWKKKLKNLLYIYNVIKYKLYISKLIKCYNGI